MSSDDGDGRDVARLDAMNIAAVDDVLSHRCTCCDLSQSLGNSTVKNRVAPDVRNQVMKI